MKLKSLLFMVTLLLSCLGVRAAGNVVFEEHFMAEPSDPSAVGFYEFVNFEEGDEWSVSDGSLFLFNSDGTLDSDSWWRRAIKFRNLRLEEGKNYRLDFKLKGSNRYDDGTGKEGDARPRCKASAQLMQGEDDFDIALMDYNGNEQRFSYEAFNEEDYESYSSTFVFASEQQQKDAYAAKDKGELADKFFLSLSVYNPGMFNITDVTLTEVNAVQSVQYGQYAIQVGFGSNTNIAALARADEKGLVVIDDLSLATVKAGNEVMEVEAIEYHSDGYLYIFTVEAIEGEGVVVSFTNPTDDNQIKYNGKVESQASVFNFENEEAGYNEALEGEMAYLYQEPKLMTSNPKDRSFAIDNTLSEFSFTFDRKVATATAKAILNRGGEEMELVVKEGQEEYAETVVFVRNDNGLLAKNNKITLSNIFSEYEIEKTDGYSISFETGKPKIAQEIYTPVQTIEFSNDAVNTIPLGWTLRNDITADNPEGEVRESGSSQGSGPRLFGYSTGDYTKVFYVRSNVASPGYTTATYGDLENYSVTLPVGELRIQFLASGYKTAGQKVRCEVLDATTAEPIVSLDYTMNEVTPDGGPAAQEKIEIPYTNTEEKNVVLRYTVFGDGMKETMLSAVIVNTYEKTEGETPNDQTIFADATYGGAGNNRTPKAESGWELWQAGERRAPDTDFNYNGTRIFNDLALKGLKVGYYCNGQWPNGYMIYGTGDLEGAPTLTLPKASLDVTYYAANWKVDEAREIHFQIINAEGTPVFDKTTYTSPVNMDGQRSASYEADKFSFSFDCPAEGLYTIKLGSPAGETFIGNISIVQPGSRAVKFYSLLADAVASAKETLVKCEEEVYDGTTKTALTDAVAKYEDQDKIEMTTEDEFLAAIAELNDLTKAMETRYDYITRFNTAVSDAAGLLADATGTKYEKLESYQALDEVFMNYKDVNASDLEDDELISSTTDMENYNTLFNNMKDHGVALLTKQINALADQLVEMDVEMMDDYYVQAAREAITDDQEIAYQLKLRLTKAIYDQCAEGDPFKTPVYDPETGEEIPGEFETATLSAGNYIQNAGFYVAGLTSNSREMGSVDQIVGWDVDMKSGKPIYEQSWVQWKGSEYNPIVDTYMIGGWNSDLQFSQNVSELPVGQYSLVVATQDRGFGDNSDGKKAALETRPHWTVVGTDGTNQIEGEEFSYIFWQNGDNGQIMTPFDISQQGQWYALTDCTTDAFTVGGELMADVTVGARMIEYQASASIDNFKLVMSGKVEGFDYAAASAKLAELIDGSTPIKGDVNHDGEVNVGDLVCVSNYMAGDVSVSLVDADVNGDGEVNVGDLVTISNIMAGGDE